MRQGPANNHDVLVLTTCLQSAPEHAAVQEGPLAQHRPTPRQDASCSSGSAVHTRDNTSGSQTSPPEHPAIQERQLSRRVAQNQLVRGAARLRHHACTSAERSARRHRLNSTMQQQLLPAGKCGCTHAIQQASAWRVDTAKRTGCAPASLLRVCCVLPTSSLLRRSKMRTADRKGGERQGECSGALTQGTANRGERCMQLHCGRTPAGHTAARTGCNNEHPNRVPLWIHDATQPLQAHQCRRNPQHTAAGCLPRWLCAPPRAPPPLLLLSCRLLTWRWAGRAGQCSFPAPSPTCTRSLRNGGAARNGKEWGGKCSGAGAVSRQEIVSAALAPTTNQPPARGRGGG